MGALQSTAFKLACNFYNWRNGRTHGAGSSDDQSLQNSDTGGSTSQLRHDLEPLIPKTWHRQMLLPFKPSRFREPYKPARSKATPTHFVIKEGEKDEERRRRLYSALETTNSALGG